MSVVNVAELITDPDFMKTIQVRTATRTLANEGEATLVYGSPVDMAAAVDPVGSGDAPEEVSPPSEGERRARKIIIYTEAELHIADGADRPADVVVYKGLSYKVVGSEDFGDSGYWRSTAVEIAP